MKEIYKIGGMLGNIKARRNLKKFEKGLDILYDIVYNVIIIKQGTKNKLKNEVMQMLGG